MLVYPFSFPLLGFRNLFGFTWMVGWSDGMEVRPTRSKDESGSLYASQSRVEQSRAEQGQTAPLLSFYQPKT
jgi:hypothetical protein